MFDGILLKKVPEETHPNVYMCNPDFSYLLKNAHTFIFPVIIIWNCSLVMDAGLINGAPTKNLLHRPEREHPRRQSPQRHEVGPFHRPPPLNYHKHTYAHLPAEISQSSTLTSTRTSRTCSCTRNDRTQEAAVERTAVTRSNLATVGSTPAANTRWPSSEAVTASTSARCELSETCSAASGPFQNDTRPLPHTSRKAQTAAGQLS